jgi:YHS domain-containing protein
MIRAILFLVIGIFIITFLRMVIGIIMRGMGDMLRQQSTAQAPPGRPTSPPISGELKRDPVCGTFVPASTTFRKTVNGQPVHFCSAECRDKFA